MRLTEARTAVLQTLKEAEGKLYRICRPDDGLLYVEVPDFGRLRNLLLNQRWRSTANLRTRHGYVPYSGGGIAFKAVSLFMRGVKPLWYPAPGVSGRFADAVTQTVADGIYKDEWEAEQHSQQSSYRSECEWRGPRGMRFSPQDIAFVWIGNAAKREHPTEEMVANLRAFLPPSIPIHTDAPLPFTGRRPTEARLTEARRILAEASDPLGLAVTTENGVRFETGKPVTFTYLRNTVSAGRAGGGFQQDIEPAGRYMTHFTGDDPTNLPQDPSGRTRWTTGSQTFRNPLVLAFNTHGGMYDETSWKARLAQAFNATGKRLSAKLRAQGHDGIVTTDRYGTSEIVAL